MGIHAVSALADSIDKIRQVARRRRNYLLTPRKAAQIMEGRAKVSRADVSYWREHMVDIARMVTAHNTSSDSILAVPTNSKAVLIRENGIPQSIQEARMYLAWGKGRKTEYLFLTTQQDGFLVTAYSEMRTGLLYGQADGLMVLGRNSLTSIEHPALREHMANKVTNLGAILKLMGKGLKDTPNYENKKPTQLELLVGEDSKDGTND